MSVLKFGMPDWFLGIKTPGITPVPYGGTWQASYPVTNLADLAVAKVARSSSLNNSGIGSVAFIVDLGVVRNVGFVAVPFHNCSPTATFFVTLYDGSNTQVLQTNAVNVFPEYPFYSDPVGAWQTPIVAQFQPAAARYVRVDIVDNSNPAGYIEVSRVIAAQGYTPVYDPAYGAQFGVEDLSQVQGTIGGREIVDVRPRRRVLRFTLPSERSPSDYYLDYYQGELLAQMGVGAQFFVSWNAADANARRRRSFLCRMRALNPLESAAYNAYNQAFELSEVIA